MRPHARGVEELRTFDVLVDADGNRKAVKAGWSWPAFLFGSIWALFGGLWGIAIIMLPVEFLLALITSAVDRAIDGRQQIYDNETTAILLLVMSVPLIIRVFFGAFGNRWKLKRLKSAGYSPLISVRASSRKMAILSCSQDTAPNILKIPELANLQSTIVQPYSSEGHISIGPSDPRRNQVNDIAKLLLALITGIVICMFAAIGGGVTAIIGCVPAIVLMVGFIASITSGNFNFIEGTTKLISIIGYILLGICLILTFFMQYIVFNVPPDGWANQANYAISIPLLGMDYVYPDQILRDRNISVALSLFFLLGIVALRFLWLFPLKRQFEAIRSISFEAKKADNAIRSKILSIASNGGLPWHWLWTASAAILFLFLMSRGHDAAAIFIAVSGLVAAPSLAPMFHRYGGSERLRNQLCLGAAGLSCTVMLLFSSPSTTLADFT